MQHIDKPLTPEEEAERIKIISELLTQQTPISTASRPLTQTPISIDFSFPVPEFVEPSPAPTPVLGVVDWNARLKGSAILADEAAATLPEGQIEAWKAQMSQNLQDKLDQEVIDAMMERSPVEPDPESDTLTLDKLASAAAKAGVSLKVAPDPFVPGGVRPYKHPTKASHEESKAHRKMAKASRRKNRR